MDPAQPLLTPSPRQGPGAPAQTWLLPAAGQVSGSSASPSKLPTGFLPSCLALAPSPRTWQCGSNSPREARAPVGFPLPGACVPTGRHPGLAGGCLASGEQSRSSPPGLAVNKLSPGFQLTPFLQLTWGFPWWKGSGHGSRHLLWEPRSAPGQDSCWRRAAAGGGGTGPAGNASSRPASSLPASAQPCHSTKGPWCWAARDSAVTRRLPAPADHTLLFSHNPHEMQK